MSVPNISSVWRSFFDLYAKTAKQNKFEVNQPLDYLYSLLIGLEIKTEDIKTKGYYTKLISELNNIVDSCVKNALNDKLTPTKRNQLVAILENKNQEEYQDRVDNYLDELADDIAFLFKVTPVTLNRNAIFKVTPVTSNRNAISKTITSNSDKKSNRSNYNNMSTTIPLINFIDDPQFIKSNEAKLLGVHLNSINQLTPLLSHIPRDILIKLSSRIDDIHYQNDITKDIFQIQGEIEDFVLYLQSYKPLTLNNMSQFPDLFNMLQILLNLSEKSLGDSVITSIENCVITNFINKLFDDELQVLSAGFNQFIISERNKEIK
jgi:hypothetical protein